MRQLKIHRGHVRAVGYSPDGQWLVSAGNDQMVRLIEVAAGKVRRKWGEFHHVMSVATFSPSATLIVAAGTHRSIQLLAPEEAFEAMIASYPPDDRLVENYPFNVTALGYSPDGKRFFAGIGEKQTATYLGEVNLWNCSTERE